MTIKNSTNRDTCRYSRGGKIAHELKVEGQTGERQLNRSETLCISAAVNVRTAGREQPVATFVAKLKAGPG